MKPTTKTATSVAAVLNEEIATTGALLQKESQAGTAETNNGRCVIGLEPK